MRCGIPHVEKKPVGLSGLGTEARPEGALACSVDWDSIDSRLAAFFEIKATRPRHALPFFVRLCRQPPGAPCFFLPY